MIGCGVADMIGIVGSEIRSWVGFGSTSNATAIRVEVELFTESASDSTGKETEL